MKVLSAHDAPGVVDEDGLVLDVVLLLVGLVADRGVPSV